MIINLLTSSLIMSATIVGLTLMSRLFKRPTLARLRYVCWMVVVLGLLIPVRFSVISFDKPMALTQVENMAAESITLQSSGKAATVSEDSASDAFENARIQAMLDTAQLSGGDAPAAASQMSLGTLLLIIWGAGCSAFLMMCAIRHILFMRHVKRWGYFSDDKGLLGTLEHIRGLVKLKRKVSLLICRAVDTPVMIGFFKPSIVLPESCTKDDTLELVLAHELLHCKYNDIWVRTLTLLAWGVNWFNPFMFLMNRAMSRDCEIACDQAVLRYMGTEQRKKYGEAVLETAYRAAVGVRKPCATISPAFSNGTKHLKSRIASIAEQRNMKRWAAAFCALVLTSVTLFSALFTGCESPDMGTVVSMPEIEDAPVNLTPTNELIVYIPAWSQLDPVMDRYRELYPNVNLIEVNVTDSNEALAYDGRISTELAEGRGPDVIFPSAAFNIDDHKAANTGAFLNLSEIIAQDEDFNPGDYVEAVFNSGMYRGRQYIIPLAYSLYTYTSSEERLSGIGFDLSKTSDTVSFLNEAVRCLPKAEDDPEFLYMFPSSKYLTYLLKASGIQLVDYNTSTVLPDEKGLKDLLDAYKPYYPIDYKSTEKTNYIFNDNNSITEIIYSSSATKSEGGYVSSTMRRLDGALQAISYSTAAIRSGSSNQLNAWNFIKLLLSPEFQGVGRRFIQPGIPVLKSAISAEVERAGNYYGGEVKQESGLFGGGVTFTQLSPEEIQAYHELFTGVDYCIGYSEGQLFVKFFEHMEPYLSGKSSFKDCVKGLKDDLKVYVTG